MTYHCLSHRHASLAVPLHCSQSFPSHGTLAWQCRCCEGRSGGAAWSSVWWGCLGAREGGSPPALRHTYTHISVTSGHNNTCTVHKTAVSVLHYTSWHTNTNMTFQCEYSEKIQQCCNCCAYFNTYVHHCLQPGTHLCELKQCGRNAAQTKNHQYTSTSFALFLLRFLTLQIVLIKDNWVPNKTVRNILLDK